MDDRAELDAPTDVSATIDWLLDEGFAIDELRAVDQPNGDRVIRLVGADETVIIQRDRGVWEFAMRGDGWVGGLHTLREAATGVAPTPDPSAGPWPRQHPADELAWAEAVPAIFRWRGRTPDWRARHDAVLEAGAERIRGTRGD